MQKIFFLILILSFLTIGLGVLAQENDLPSPGVTPDSPFYFLDTLGEKIGMFFTFGAEKKAEKAMQYVEEKLAELKAMAEKNKTQALERAIQKYQEFLGLANQKTKEAKEEGKDVEGLVSLIVEKTLKHQEVLLEVFEKVSEEAKDAVQKAIEISRRGSEEAVQAVTGAKKGELLQKIEEVKIKVETADWKIYINEKYGYSFRHPPEWDFKVTLTNPETRELYVIREEISNRTETNVGRWFITISTWDNPQNLSLGKWLSSWVRALPADAPLVANTSVGEEKVEALQVWQGGTSTWDKPGRCFQACPYLEVYFVYISKGYRATLNYEGEVNDIDQGSQKIFKQILSTFKFIELEEAKEEAPKIEEVPKIEEKPAAPDTPAMRDIDVSTTAGVPYKIGWTTISGAKTYILERDINSSFSNSVTVYSGQLNSFSETLSPSVSTRYYFRVKACNKYGCSSWSKITALWVEVCPLPETPVLTDPGISVKNNESLYTFNLNWTSVSGAKGYWYQSGYGAPSFPEPGYYSESNSVRQTVPRDASVTYYYRVKACNDCGCSAWSNVVDIQVIVPSITVTSPNGGERWVRGSTYTIRWQSPGLEKVTINLINYSTGGQYGIATEIPAASGYYSWTVPSEEGPVITGNNYKIAIGYLGTNDFSDNYFSIVSSLKPMGSNCTYNEECESNTCVRGRESVVGVCSEKYTGESCVDGDNGDYYVKGTVFGISNVGTGWDKTIYHQLTDICSKDVAGNDPGLKSLSEYKCMYSDYAGRKVFTSSSYDCPYGCQDGACLPGIIVTSPNGGEQWIKGNTYDITWSSAGIEKVDVSYLNMAIGLGQGIGATGILASLGKYSFTIPTADPNVQIGDKYKVYIRGKAPDGSRIEDWSDNYFSIGPSPPPPEP